MLLNHLALNYIRCLSEITLPSVVYVQPDFAEIARSPLTHIPNVNLKSPPPIKNSAVTTASHDFHMTAIWLILTLYAVVGNGQFVFLKLFLQTIPNGQQKARENPLSSYIPYNSTCQVATLLTMAAMVQSFPQPTSTMTMLQTRPSSSDAFQSRSQGQQHQSNPQIPRNIYNTSVGGMAAGNYRGQTPTQPVAPYAFQSTPILQSGPNPLRQHPPAPPNPRLENRTASAPVLPVTLQTLQHTSQSSRPRPSPTKNVSISNTLPTQQQLFKDDPPLLPALHTQQPPSRPNTYDLNPPSLQPASYATVAKSSPDRYRRNHRRAETSGALPLNGTHVGGSAMPSGSGMATVGHLYNHPMQSSSTPALSDYRGAQSPSLPVTADHANDSQPRIASKDDMNLQRERQASSDLAKRYRRRSISSLEAKDYTLSEGSMEQPTQPKTYAAMLAGPAPGSSPTASQPRNEARVIPPVDRPSSAHGRHGSNESSHSGRSAPKPSSVSHSRPTICDIISTSRLDLYSRACLKD